MPEIVGARLGTGWGWNVGEPGWKPGVDNNFQMFDTLTGLWVISDALTAPPGSPSDGDTYIVATGGSGAWSGHDGKVAASMNGTWYFFPPVAGLRGWFDSLGEFCYYDGTVWVAEVTSSRNSAVMQAQWVSGAIVANTTIHFVFKAPYSGTIDSLDYFAGNGSFDVAIKINGTNVTGLSAVTVNSATPANAAASGARTFAAGDDLTGVIASSTSSPTNALLSLNVTWNPGGSTTEAVISTMDFSTLPTSDPGSGRLWLNGGVLQVGA